MFFSRKKGYKKGQFTIFVIVGLVIMFVFGFALYARIQVAKASYAQQADVILRDYMSKNSINQYVTSCLDAVVDETFLTTSMQGGLITIEGDNRYTIKYEPIKYYDQKLKREFNVSVSIYSNYNCPDNRDLDEYIVTDEPGLYPYNCRYASFSELQTLYKKFGTTSCKNSCTLNNFWTRSGFFGINEMRVLCDGYGANAPRAGINQNSLTCDYYTYKRDSLQEAMQDKITAEVKKCINFTEIVKRSPSNITVDEASAKTTIIFGKEQFDVRLEYPFTVTVRNKEPVTRMVNFSVNRQVPFKELYEYAYELSNSDVMNIWFDMNTNYTNLKGRSARRLNRNIYDSDFTINIIKGNFDNGFIDFVQIIDSDNYILGSPLTINFGIKNRRPALDYIKEGNSEWFDIATAENNTIQFNPVGIDPDDETPLRYVYSGWKEEYLDEYNYDDPKCTTPDEDTTIEYIFEHCTKKVDESEMDGIDEIYGPEDFPRNWTRSELFEKTLKNASVKMTKQDVGFHTVTISVYDRQELYDKQEVRILVMDLPLAKVEGSNLYDDVNDAFASTEDQYILDGSGSSPGNIASIMGVTLAGFTWIDKSLIEPFPDYTSIFTPDNQKKILELPKDFLGPIPTNITDIVNWPFKKPTTGIPKEGIIHEIEFTVRTNIGLESTEVIKINVTQCLPHRSSTPSYPYTSYSPYSIADDDMQAQLNANHTCCSEDYTYYDKSKECFAAINYGRYNKMINYQTDSQYKTKIPPEKYTIIPQSINSLQDNDIYKQEFKRYCSGERGNICTGDGVDTRTTHEICEDINKINNPNFNNERCYGPSVNYISRTSTSPITCDEYSPGESFEKLATGGSYDGICTTTKQFASNPGNMGGKFYEYNKDSNDGTPYNFICSGQCDGQGGCGYPVSSTCECKASSLGNGNPLCDGLPYSGGFQIPLPENGGASCGRIGKSYFADLCNSGCGLIDSTFVCRSTNYGTGCNADQYCNGITPGQTAKNGGKDYCHDGKTLTICGATSSVDDSNTCKYTQPSNICRASNNNRVNCNANTKCDGITKGSAAIIDDNDNIDDDITSYCNGDCDITNCPGGYKYKISYSGSQASYDGCYTSCSSNSQCAQGFTCCTNSAGCSLDPDNPDSTKVNSGQCFKYN